MYKGEEDYLKILYEQRCMARQPHIDNQTLALKLDITIQAVNEMVKKLDAKGYLQYQPYKGSRLTELGESIAVALIAKHRLWEVFLVRYCNYDWQDVHDEAEVLEHATSDKLALHLRQLLDNPATCPHGNPIPNGGGQLDKAPLDLPLIQTALDTDYTLTKVEDNRRLLEFLNDAGLVIGSNFTVVEIDDFNQLIIIMFKGKQIAISFNIAKRLFVKIKENN